MIMSYRDNVEGKIDFEPKDVLKTRGSLVWKYFHLRGTKDRGADKKYAVEVQQKKMGIKVKPIASGCPHPMGLHQSFL